MKLSTLTAAGLLTTLLGELALAQAPTGIDCTILGDLSRRHTVARLEEKNRRQGGAIDPGYVDYRRLQICDSTVAAVTGGYAAAMAQLGMPVRWRFDDPAPFCDSQLLSQCMPFPDPAAAPLTAAELHRMRSAWEGIRSAVGAHMPWGESSNLSYFTVDSFTRTLEAGRLPQMRSGSVRD